MEERKTQRRKDDRRKYRPRRIPLSGRRTVSPIDRREDIVSGDDCMITYQDPGDEDES